MHNTITLPIFASSNSMKGLIKTKNKMTTTANYQGQEVRNSTTSEYAIFFEGKELKTSKSGAINSNGGIVLSAQLPTGEWIKWRSNDNYGKKGFSFDKPIFAAKDDNKINFIPSELRSKLEYKIF